MAWIELARLGAPYGTKGWLHVDSYTDPPDGLLKYREWALRLASGERVTRRLAGGRGHGRGLVAQLEGVTSREGAAALTGAIVEVERAALPPTGEREYYRADLVGFAVRNLDGAALGTVSHFVAQCEYCSEERACFTQESLAGKRVRGYIERICEMA